MSNAEDRSSTIDTVSWNAKRQTCLCCAFLPDDLFLPSSATTATAASQTVGTDVPASEADIETRNEWSQIPSPQDAWGRLLPTRDQSDDKRVIDTLVIIDTHGHAHLERTQDDDVALYRLDNALDNTLDMDPTANTQSKSPFSFVSLTCAVHPDDWEACIRFAQSSPHNIAALGVHPWYLADLPDDWLKRLENLLQIHPRVLVGEIGLCKMARFLRTYPQGKAAAMELQRQVFVNQLQLAARYKRPVSVHCVNQQSILLSILRDAEMLPPTIALHSFSGTSHQIKQLMEWEKSRKQETSLYFGFSYAVNYVMNTSDKSRRQTLEAIRAVPSDRLLVESDLHCTEAALGGTLATIGFLAWVLHEHESTVAARTRENALRFLQTLYKAQA
jgi:Tat protein secretion system quality control protein TatD with DNase activity